MEKNTTQIVGVITAWNKTNVTNSDVIRYMADTSYRRGWHYIVIIFICAVALVCVCRKKKRKSFDILMINLFVQNIFFLANLSYTCPFSESFLKHRIILALQYLLYFVQSATLFLLSTQRVLVVYFPLKGKIWITKRCTVIALVVEYLVTLLIMGTIPLAIKAVTPLTLSIFVSYLCGLALGISMVTSNFLIICKVMRGLNRSLQRILNTKRRKKPEDFSVILLDVCIIFIIPPYFNYPYVCSCT